MKVVSNSSPLIFLSAIGMLDFLKTEFGEVFIPKVVYDEITAKGLKGSNEVKHAGWIKVLPVKNDSSISFIPMLDEGEWKAILLVIEQKADLLLMDDLAGRRAAAMYGVNVIGTLGFLKVMQKKGKIKNLKSVLDALKTQGFWMSAELYKKMLENNRSCE